MFLRVKGLGFRGLVFMDFAPPIVENRLEQWKIERKMFFQSTWTSNGV